MIKMDQINITFQQRLRMFFHKIPKNTLWQSKNVAYLYRKMYIIQIQII